MGQAGAVRAIGVKPGEQVLVTAAAGGMGVLLVQLAWAAGGRVIGAARGGPKLDAVRHVGAEAAVDYSEPDWADRVGEYVPTVFRQRAAAALAEAAAGRIRPVIGQVFPLARAAEAHTALEARTAVAKTLLLT